MSPSTGAILAYSYRYQNSLAPALLRPLISHCSVSVRIQSSACSSFRPSLTAKAPNQPMDQNASDSPAAVSSHLNGLLHVASLTNEELFPIVVATINKWIRSTKQAKKGDKKESSNWKDVALRVATDVAKGEEKCCCHECWIAKYQMYDSGENETDVRTALSFADALKTLNREECSKKRLQNALLEISSMQTSDYSALLSVPQVVGIIRTSASLTKNDETISMQIQAMSCLTKIMPQIETTAPCDIFLAIQQPILQKLSWDVFVKSGINCNTSELSKSEFKSLLYQEVDTASELKAHAGTKRKRGDESNTKSTGDTHSSCLITLRYLLQAAHLARKGVVRAKHGAIIYIPTEDGGTQIIGRGWNHDFLLNRSKHQKNKLNLHSEVHAVADSIRNFGEDECFENLFPKATIIIVELVSDYAYEASHPCPKCDPMLRAVGISRVVHTLANGQVAELDIGPGNLDLLKNENVSVALNAACNEQRVTCKRLQD
eukprot:scaffold204477_cov69-Cyclotella_meneghiniana.AAC.1